MQVTSIALFLQSVQFLLKSTYPAYCAIKNNYKKSNFVNSMESFCQKNKSVLGTNKLQSLRWCVPCAIQTENKLCHSNSVTFDAKKAKETLMMRLSGSTITTTETTTFARLEKICLVKTPLNPWVLKTHQNVHLY